MNKTILQPLNRILSNPSLVALVLFSLSLGLIFYFMGQLLAPLIIAVAVAYLLEGIVHQFEQWKMRRTFAVCLVFFSFLLLLAYLFLWGVPTLLQQARNFIANLPDFMMLLQKNLMILPQKFPQFFTEENVLSFFNDMSNSLALFSKNLFSTQLFTSLILILTFLVYFILVPILTFFLLKDKKIILNWMGTFLPRNKQIIQDIWAEVDVQIGNYIRGKFTEIIVIWLMCLLVFYYFDLQYWLLLSFMVGLSVLIPYIGATLVTIPIVFVAYMQFGLGSSFYWVMGLYCIIQILDANIVVPIIFSEAVNIHPVAIVAAVLVFGGLWGFWGVFLAIPLATLVKAILEAWRRAQDVQIETAE